MSTLDTGFTLGISPHNGHFRNNRYTRPQLDDPATRDNFNNGNNESNVERQNEFHESPRRRPRNSRSAAPLLANQVETCETGDNFSQFQLYCDTTYDNFEASVPQMKFPFVARFFSNEMPGYAAIFHQDIRNARSYGEAYWLGWVIPFWLSLPASLMSDSDKRKLLVFWIARNRLGIDKMPFRKLSVLLGTYYPHYDGIVARNNQILQKNPERAARGEPLLDPLVNIVQSADVNFAYPSLDEPNFVASVNQGKGSDLTKVKNVPISFISEQIFRVRSSDNSPYDQWIDRPPFGQVTVERSEAEKDRNPRWEDTFTKSAIIAPAPFNNNNNNANANANANGNSNSSSTSNSSGSRGRGRQGGGGGDQLSNHPQRLQRFMDLRTPELLQILDRFSDNWLNNHPDPTQRSAAQAQLMAYTVLQYLYAIDLPDISRYNQSSVGSEVPITQS
jgi:hypothetical protein